MKLPSLSACLLLAAAASLQGWQTADAGLQTDLLAAAAGQQHGASAQARSPAAGPADTPQADLLFVQQASAAELVFESPDTAPQQARLLLHGVAPSTTWFTDKPIRRAGALETAFFASSETFASGGTWLGAPNAALTGTHEGRPYVVIVTLYNPLYDNKTHTMQYEASLRINGTDPRSISNGGAVQFQAQHAVESLGALAYMSIGEDAFRLENAALFIDDFLGAYPNGICLSSFVSCPNYYGWWAGGGRWGPGYGPGFANYIGIRRLCPKCWDKADNTDDDGVPAAAPAAAPEEQQQGSPSPSPTPSPSPYPQHIPLPERSPGAPVSSGSLSGGSSPSPAGGGSWHCTGCSSASGKYSCDSCKWW